MPSRESSPRETEVGLRAVAEADREFLLSVYASTREAELARVAWPAGGKEAFLRQQFEAQDTYWREQRPEAVFQVIEVGGEPAGRLYVDAQPDEVRIVDIALLPGFRGRGIGTALLREIIERAEADRIPVTIHVEQQNPARSLYQRLGFERVETHGIYDLLQRSPAT